MASLNSNWLANPIPDSRPKTPPATCPPGHLSTGETPNHFVSLPTSDNETAPVVDGQILSELHGNVILIKPEAFIQKVMYVQAESPTSGVTGAAASLSDLGRHARDQKLAEDCLAALKSRNDSPMFKNVVQSLAVDENRTPRDVVEGISSYASDEFTKLVTGIEVEKDLYRPLAALFAFISHFYRCYFDESLGNGEWSVEIDKSWPPAADPKRHQSQGRMPLRRGFLISYNKPFRFSPHVEGPPDLQPDIALVLFQKRKRAKSPNPAEIRWWDVKVPIEVKLRDGFDANRVCQMARYARAIKMEQFDRNFIFSILISKTKCRVFYWDASQSYVTEIDIHKEPTILIQVIGRLASMDPQSMGYDTRFSNAGRVLASESQAMATKLEVVSTVPTQFHDQHPETQTNNTIVIDLFTNRPLFEARGLLFSRFTRVWEGREVIGADWENGALRVVKQNWADAERVNEAFLYEKTKEVPNVARLVGSEAGSCTIGTSTWRDSDIVGVYRKGQPNAESLPYLDLAIDEEPFTLYKWDVRPQTFSRVLVRMVFEEKGRSNLEVRDSRELLEATKQWLTGLWGLKEKGILHRDVSSGNLLLGHDAYSPAFIIDLGLAHWDGDCQDNSSDHRSGDKRVAKAHHHLTGTLPFISYELLEARILDQTLKHEVRHDIESVFWVLLYLILREERSKHAKTALSALLSTDFKVVRGEKSVFLGRALNPDYALGLKLEGRFKDLARFVYRFASLFSPSETNTIKLEDIFSMIDTEILSLPQGSGKKVEPEVILPSVGSGRSKRKYDPAKDLAGQVDENRPGQSSRGLRATRSSSRLVRQRVES